MQTRRVRVFFAAVLLVASLGLSSALRTNADKVMPIPVEVPQRTSAKRVKTDMQLKELGAQRILSGLVHRDFAAIRKGAAALRQVSLDGPKHRSGDRTADRIYAHFRLEFTRSATKLETMAEAQNLEGAAYTYQNLTATCIACHEHLRDVKSGGTRK